MESFKQILYLQQDPVILQISKSKILLQMLGVVKNWVLNIPQGWELPSSDGGWLTIYQY